MTPLPGGHAIFAELVESFIASPKFQGLTANSRKLWTRELREAGDLDMLGAYALTEIRPALIQGYLDGFHDRPAKQGAALAALKAVEKWAVVRDLLPRPITLGVETGRPQGGHIPWTGAQVEIAEKFGRSDIARAVTLGANTGQRVSDLVRMGPTDIETFKGHQGINVTQQKTGRQIWIPLTQKLVQAMATWERLYQGRSCCRCNRQALGGHKWLAEAWDYEEKAETQSWSNTGTRTWSGHARTAGSLLRAAIS